MKLVTDMGRIFRMSDRSYKRMLRAIANEEDVPTWETLGAKFLGNVACDTTDLGPEDAKFYLDSTKEASS